MDKYQLYEKIINNLPVGFIVVDHRGNVIEFNEPAEKITGYTKDDVTGKSHFEFLHGTSDPDICPLFRHSLRRRKKPFTSDTLMKRRDGDYITVSIISFPVFERSDPFIRGVEIFWDITESKRRERERKNFMAMFVHDMKSPVIASKGFLSRLLAGKAGPFTERQRNYLELIGDGLSELEKLVAEFLEFTKYEAKKFRPSLMPFNIEEALKKNIETLKVEYEKKRIYLQFESSPQVPLIKADDTMINRVISNLLTNAIKYTEPGGFIKVRCLDTERNILVQVINSGAIIPEKQLPYIFEAFYRARSDEKGLGLGLAISKKIVELHNGKIWAQVTPVKETVFCFTLPKQ